MANIESTSFPGAVTEEMKKFQGAWKQVAYERDGVTEPVDEQGWEPRVTLTGDAFVVTAPGVFRFSSCDARRGVGGVDRFCAAAVAAV